MCKAQMSCTGPLTRAEGPLEIGLRRVASCQNHSDTSSLHYLGHRLGGLF